MPKRGSILGKRRIQQIAKKETSELFDANSAEDISANLVTITTEENELDNLILNPNKLDFDCECCSSSELNQLQGRAPEPYGRAGRLPRAPRY